MNDGEWNRRKFLQGAAATGLMTVVPAIEARENSASSAPNGAFTQSVTLQVNGMARRLDVDTRSTLLDTLREQLSLFGTKKGCDHGQCGACTVHVNGRRINSCLTLAVMHDGDEITTIEGLAHGEELHPVQVAFVEQDAFQCGYCTPGQIMSAAALLNEPCAGTDDEIRECMSGNICRCGAYPNIVAAVKSARNRT